MQVFFYSDASIHFFLHVFETNGKCACWEFEDGWNFMVHRSNTSRSIFSVTNYNKCDSLGYSRGKQQFSILLQKVPIISISVGCRFSKVVQPKRSTHEIRIESVTNYCFPIHRQFPRRHIGLLGFFELCFFSASWFSQTAKSKGVFQNWETDQIWPDNSANQTEGIQRRTYGL